MSQDKFLKEFAEVINVDRSRLVGGFQLPDGVWESDDCVRRTGVLPTGLAERLAAEAERRGLSVSDR